MVAIHGPGQNGVSDDLARRCGIRVDRYDVWHFSRLVARSERVAAIIDDDPRLWRGRVLAIYAALYKPQPELSDSAPAAAVEFARALLGQPILRQLRPYTHLDEGASVDAIIDVLRHLQSLKKETRAGAGRQVVAAVEALVGDSALPAERNAIFAAVEARLDSLHGPLDPEAARPAMYAAVHKSIDAYESAVRALAEFDRAEKIDHHPAADGVAAGRALERFTRARPQPPREPPMRRRGVPPDVEDRRAPLAARMRQLRHLTLAVQEKLAALSHAGTDTNDNRDVEQRVGIALAATLRDLNATNQAITLLRQLLPSGQAWGIDAGSLHRMPLDEVRQIARALREHPDILRIVELAGRWLETFRAARPRRRGKGREETVGVTLGGDLGDILPQELLLLRRAGRLRTVALARIIERRALVREMKGPALLGRGPVIVIIDTSGSMAGARVVFAKAVALAIVTRAIEQRRPALVLTFGARGEMLEVHFSPRESPGNRILRLLDLSFGGGTNFDGPLERIVEVATERPWSSADAVFVSDGDCEASPVVIERVKNAKRSADLDLIALLVGRGRGLQPIADQLLSIDPDVPPATPADGLLARM